MFSAFLEVNYQLFEVVAVDNDGNVDETPATKAFYTFPTFFPETRLVTPSSDRQDTFAKAFVDEWWKGVLITYTASDNDGEVEEYAWAINDGDWHWTTDTFAYVQPEEFLPELEGTHTIRVTSRDDTRLIDPIGASRRIDLEVPTFDRDIIIMDETVEDATLPDLGWVTDAITDSMYFEIFGGNDRNLQILQWDYVLRGLPPMRFLKQYKMIVWHKDHYGTRTGINASDEILSEYLKMGGKLVIVGQRILWQFMDPSYFLPPPFSSVPVSPLVFNSGDAFNGFVNTYMHINVADLTDIQGNVNGYSGINLFTGELRIDESKTNPLFPFFNKINHTFVFQQLGGFTVPIYQYNGTDEEFDGLPCGLRYFGSVFDLVYLAFPLWHLNGDDAKSVGNQILDSMGF